jgi:catechol 2,3-dioxygenase-like lactoylglutathione lyase family enzyme
LAETVNDLHFDCQLEDCNGGNLELDSFLTALLCLGSRWFVSCNDKEVIMAKLRHIALHTPDPEKTAEFYKRVFDMVEVGRTDSPIAKGIYLSDGTINMAVLRFKTKEAADRNDGLGPVFGLHHFGFWVEDPDETRRRLKEAGADYRFGRPEEATTSFFEEKYKGPDAVMIDITKHGWVGAEPLLPAREKE